VTVIATVGMGQRDYPIERGGAPVSPWASVDLKWEDVPPEGGQALTQDERNALRAEGLDSLGFASQRLDAEDNFRYHNVFGSIDLKNGEVSYISTA